MADAPCYRSLLSSWPSRSTELTRSSSTSSSVRKSWQRSRAACVLCIRLVLYLQLTAVFALQKAPAGSSADAEKLKLLQKDYDSLAAKYNGLSGGQISKKAD